MHIYSSTLRNKGSFLSLYSSAFLILTGNAVVSASAARQEGPRYGSKLKALLFDMDLEPNNALSTD